MAEVSNIVSCLQALNTSSELPTSLGLLTTNMEQCVSGEVDVDLLKVYMPKVFGGLIKLIQSNPEVRLIKLEILSIRLLIRLGAAGLNLSKMFTPDLSYQNGSSHFEVALALFSEVFTFLEQPKKVETATKLLPVLENTLEESNLHEHSLLSTVLSTLSAIAPRTLHNMNDKQRRSFIESWLRSGEASFFINPSSSQWKVVQGIQVVDFFSELSNFELWVDLVLTDGEREDSRALSALTNLHNAKVLLKTYRLDPVTTIVSKTSAALVILREKRKVCLALKLLDYWIKKDTEKGMSKFIELGTAFTLLEHLNISMAQHFLFHSVLLNNSISLHLQTQIHTELLPGLLTKVFEMIDRNPELLHDYYLKRLDGISNFLHQLLGSVMSRPNLAAADEVRDVENKNMFKHNSELRTALFTSSGEALLATITKACFGDFEDTVKYEFIDILNNLLQSFKDGVLKDFAGILENVSSDMLLNIERMISASTLSTKHKMIKLTAFTVERPINLHMLSIIRVLHHLLVIFPSLTRELKPETLNSLFMWLFVYKTNGMLCGLISGIGKLFMEQATEAVIREILVSRGLVHRLVNSYSERSNAPSDRDFNLCVKVLIRKISEVVHNKKTSFSEEILVNDNWKYVILAERPKEMPKPKRRK